MRTVLEQIFLGRTGMDQLNKLLLTMTAVSYVASAMSHPGFLKVLLHYTCLFAAALCLMRALSRNLERRREENQRFLSRFGCIYQGWENRQARAEQRRLYKIFKCPSCGVKLRVPRGKGTLRITCRQCGAQFEKKS